MPWGVDFEERTFGDAVLRCNLLIGDVEVFDRLTGEVLVQAFGSEHLGEMIALQHASGKRPDVYAALVQAGVDLAEQEGRANG